MDSDLTAIYNRLNIKSVVSENYNDIKGLKQNKDLVPNQWYRITDYRGNVSSSIASSANHRFDILVKAISDSEFDHNAYAVKHEGDTYFDGCDLSAWEIKYDFDADPNKYDWAPNPNAKGEGFNIYGTAITEGAIPAYDTVAYKSELNEHKTLNMIQDEEMSFDWIYAYPITDELHDDGMNFRYCATLNPTNDDIAFGFGYLFTFNNRDEIVAIAGEETANQVEALTGTDYPKNVCTGDTMYVAPIVNGDWSTAELPEELQTFFSYINAAPQKNNGIIYYMKDEWGNEAPYDFKNIIFEFDGWSYYTFSCPSPIQWNEKIDGTVLNPDEVLFKNNKIGECFKWAGSMSTWEIYEYNVRTLNKNIFETGGVAVISNTLGRNCENNYIGNSSYTKIEDFGLGNTIKRSNGNNFKTCCYQNMVQMGFGNTFGMGCHDNFLKYAWNNDFQDGCYSNIIDGQDSDDNSSYGNIFGNNCRNNQLRYNCRYNIFAGGVEGNQLADSCYNCTFDTYANNNIVPRVCKYIHFGSQCHNIELKRRYTRYVTIEDNCANLNITSSENTSPSKHIQNIRILSGLNGGENTSQVTITVSTLENKYPIHIGLDGNNDIVERNPLD